MKAQLDCIYKGIREVPKGSFTNEKGENINYNDRYYIRFDQIVKGLPAETEIRVTKEQGLNIARQFTLYDKIIITFNVIIGRKQNYITFDSIIKVNK